MLLQANVYPLKVGTRNRQTPAKSILLPAGKRIKMRDGARAWHTSPINGDVPVWPKCRHGAHQKRMPPGYEYGKF